MINLTTNNRVETPFLLADMSHTVNLLDYLEELCECWLEKDEKKRRNRDIICIPETVLIDIEGRKDLQNICLIDKGRPIDKWHLTLYKMRSHLGKSAFRLCNDTISIKGDMSKKELWIHVGYWREYKEG